MRKQSDSSHNMIFIGNIQKHALYIYDNYNIYIRQLNIKQNMRGAAWAPIILI